MEPPDPSSTDAQLGTLDGTDYVTDTSQCTAEVEPCQRMEVTEPQGDFPTCHDGESYLLLSLGATVQYGTRRKLERAVKE